MLAKVDATGVGRHIFFQTFLTNGRGAGFGGGFGRRRPVWPAHCVEQVTRVLNYRDTVSN
jgi:hypothetical protein